MWKLQKRSSARFLMNALEVDANYLYRDYLSSRTIQRLYRNVLRPEEKESILKYRELSESRKMEVLLVQPGMYPQKATIGTELKDFQDAVGGTIAASYPFDDPVAIVYNDEGKLTGLPLNRALRDEDGRMYDAVAGTFLVVGLGEEDFASLSPELAQKYEKQFHQPETFLKLGNRLLVIPVPDDAVKSAENKVVIKPPAEHDR